MLATTKLLSQQIIIMFVETKYFCCDKTFVVTYICHDKHMFVMTSFVTTKGCYVVTNVCLS